MNGKMKKNKVCMLLSNPFTHDNRVYREAKTLVDAGYGVTIVCPKCDKDLPTEENIDGIIVKRVLSCYLPFFPLNKFEYKECRLFLRMAAQEKADVYHSHDFDTLLYGYLCSMKNKSKLVYDSHEYWRDKSYYYKKFSFKNYIYNKFTSFEKFLIRKANSVITVSDGIANLLRADNSLEIKPTVIRNIPLLSGFGQKKLGNKKVGLNKVIIYIGALIENRGLEKIISYVNESSEPIKLKLVGYGDLATKLDSLNFDRKKVKFYPAVPASEVLKTISQADIGIIPTQDTSISHHYSLPNKLFDYIGAEVPILATDLPEIKKVIRSYKIGEVFNLDSKKEFDNALSKILNNYVQYKDNTKKAKIDLNWEKESQKLLGLYKKIFKEI